MEVNKIYLLLCNLGQASAEALMLLLIEWIRVGETAGSSTASAESSVRHIM